MLRTTYLYSNWTFTENTWKGRRIGNSNVPTLPATVPGHVHLDLVAAGIISDPFVRMNELGVQWVDEKDWTYETTFTWAPDAGLPYRVLRFEGLDTICEIFLNDAKIGASDNMFIPVEIDVTEFLLEGENRLRIEFQSAIRVGEERAKAFYAAEGLEARNRFPERAFVRKAQYMYGWDWGPRLASCGIWKPVSLLEYSSRILDVHVTQEHQPNGVVVVNIHSQVQGEGSIVHFLDGAGTLIGDGQLVMDRPPLWSPENPVLLELISVVIPKDQTLDPEELGLTEEENDFSEEFISAAQLAIANTLALDSRTQQIGLKTFELRREKDEWGESFEFVLNGKPIWTRGANWIPDHSFPSIISRQRTREQIERAKDMGCNMLRVWGGGLYESDDFYDLCDEIGMLVWQDFTYACSLYPDNEAEQKVAYEEAAANIKRLRNHSSLAFWCGNNENYQLFFQRWMGDNTPARFYGRNLYEKSIPKALAEFDPSRPYIFSSAIWGTEQNDIDPNQGGFGDQHNWDVWHGRGDWRFYTDSTARFSSEFGFCSAAALSVWAKYLDEEDWSPHSPAVKWHDKTGKGDGKFHEMVELHYPKSITLEDWVYYSQLNQRDALRFGIEHYRRSEFCKGSLIWQINDCWPVTSWAFVDFEGNYKALGYELRRIYAPFLLSLHRKNEKVEAWAILDGAEYDIEDGQLTITAYSTLTGEVLKTWETEFDAADDSRSKILEIDITGLNVRETILVAEAEGYDAWMLLSEPKEQNVAPPCPLLVSTHADGVLRIQTTAPVIDLMLTANGATVDFDENFYTLLEPGIIEVPVKNLPNAIEARSLAGEHPIRVTRSPI